MNCGPDLLREEEEQLVLVFIEACFGDYNGAAQVITYGVKAINRLRKLNRLTVGIFVPKSTVKGIVGVKFLVPLVVINRSVESPGARFGYRVDGRAGSSTV